MDVTFRSAATGVIGAASGRHTAAVMLDAPAAPSVTDQSYRYASPAFSFVVDVAPTCTP